MYHIKDCTKHNSWNATIHLQPSTIHLLPSTIYLLPSTIHLLPSTIHLPSSMIQLLTLIIPSLTYIILLFFIHNPYYNNNTIMAFSNLTLSIFRSLLCRIWCQSASHNWQRVYVQLCDSRWINSIHYWMEHGAGVSYRYECVCLCA